MDRPYSVLGVEPGSDHDVVKAAYRALMKEHHPDQGGSTEEFIRVKEAYETIQNGGGSNRHRPITGSSKGPRRTATTDGGTATARGANVGGEPTTHTDPKIVACHSGAGLELRGEYLTLRLVALVQDADLSTVARVDRTDGSPTRPVAYFTVENTSDRPVRWRGNQCTTFHGTDGTRYERSGRYRPSETTLPASWNGSDVPIQPGDRMHNVVIAERMPSSVDVDRVVYTQNVFGSAGIVDKERFVFDIASTARHHLSRQPF